MFDYTFTFEEIQFFLLIFIRIASFIFIAPFFGMSNTPARLKVGLSFFITMILLNVVDKPDINYGDVIGYGILVVREAITGLLIGFAANVCNSIVLFFGNMADTNIGLSMASEYDPLSRTQVTVTGQLYNYLVLLLLLISNLQSYLIEAFVEAYQLIPVNGTVFRWDSLLESMLMYCVDMLVIAFRIVLPVFACIMILNCILGIMAKVAPQMNMFAVGIQLKLFVGLLSMLLVVELLPYMSDMIFTEMRRMVVSVVQGLY